MAKSEKWVGYSEALLQLAALDPTQAEDSLVAALRAQESMLHWFSAGRVRARAAQWGWRVETQSNEIKDNASDFEDNIPKEFWFEYSTIRNSSKRHPLLLLKETRLPLQVRELVGCADAEFRGPFAEQRGEDFFFFEPRVSHPYLSMRGWAINVEVCSDDVPGLPRQRGSKGGSTLRDLNHGLVDLAEKEVREGRMDIPRAVAHFAPRMIRMPGDGGEMTAPASQRRTFSRWLKDRFPGQ